VSERRWYLSHKSLDSTLHRQTNPTSNLNSSHLTFLPKPRRTRLHRGPASTVQSQTSRRLWSGGGRINIPLIGPDCISGPARIHRSSRSDQRRAETFLQLRVETAEAFNLHLSGGRAALEPLISNSPDFPPTADQSVCSSDRQLQDSF